MIENSLISKRDRKRLEMMQNLQVELKELEAEIFETLQWHIEREIERMEPLNIQWKYLVKTREFGYPLKRLLLDQRQAIINGSFDINSLKGYILDLPNARDCQVSYPGQRRVELSEDLGKKLAETFKDGKTIKLRELLEGGDFTKLAGRIKELRNKPTIKLFQTKREEFLGHIQLFLK